MYLTFILNIFIIHQLNLGFGLLNSTNGTNFINWSEDDWLETRFLIEKKFIFNNQHYENVLLRTRMNEWSLELSSGNRSDLNEYWTELYVFLDRQSSLNNSIKGHVRNECNEPVISPITNDSSFSIPELFDMDRRIANYFMNDGFFFRTFNYIKCTINERRREPTSHIQMNIYLVTNREFQSLIYIEMLSETQTFLSDRQARLYLHNNQAKLKYNLNVSKIIYPLTSSTELAHMIKLYNQSIIRTSSSTMLSETLIVILFNLFIFMYFLHY